MEFETWRTRAAGGDLLLWYVSASARGLVQTEESYAHHKKLRRVAEDMDVVDKCAVESGHIHYPPTIAAPVCIVHKDGDKASVPTFKMFSRSTSMLISPPAQSNDFYP